jgi:hypothetical protein
MSDKIKLRFGAGDSIEELTMLIKHFDDLSVQYSNYPKFVSKKHFNAIRFGIARIYKRHCE